MIVTATLKGQARKLRLSGRTYAEINARLGVVVPKGTLSYWCRDIQLGDRYRQKIQRMNETNLAMARSKAVEVNRDKRQIYLDSVLASNRHLATVIKDKDTAKIALAVLYLGEGGKSWKKDSLYFGNAAPEVIKLYLRLLRYCYGLDESKFRCTVQCRADQNVDELQKFWAQITDIPERQFYKVQVDERTIGKLTAKADYRGVCRIDYLSAHLFTDIMQAIKIIQDGPLAQLVERLRGTEEVTGSNPVRSTKQGSSRRVLL